MGVDGLGGRLVVLRSDHPTDVLKLIPAYHPIYGGVDPVLLMLVNDKAARGRLRAWAAFTQTAAEICRHNGVTRIDAKIARSAMTLLGGAG